MVSKFSMKMCIFFILWTYVFQTNVVKKIKHCCNCPQTMALGHARSLVVPEMGIVWNMTDCVRGTLDTWLRSPPEKYTASDIYRMVRLVHGSLYENMCMKKWIIHIWIGGQHV